jgi:hypothetical protein
MDILQLHAALLAAMRPRRPRSAADIHAAEFAQQVRAARLPAPAARSSGTGVWQPRVPARGLRLPQQLLHVPTRPGCCAHLCVSA